MIKGVILDLDGTVYRGNAEVPGAGAFVRGMRARNVRCLFVTNRANRTPDAVRDQLLGYGIPCALEDVLTSAQATALFLEPGPAFVIGETGIRRALEERGFTFTDRNPRYVIISLELNLSEAKIEQAARLINGGAQFVATNPDKVLKIEDKMVPGTGVIVEAVQARVSARPLVIGKPERRLIDMALKQLRMGPGEVILVGDNIETDVPAGEKAGVRTALLLTGVSTRDDIRKTGITPTWVIPGYEELAALVAAENTAA